MLGLMSGPSGVSFESTGAGFSHFVRAGVLEAAIGAAGVRGLAAIVDAGPVDIGGLASGGFIW
jgi:hypothetical protein